MNRLNIKVEQSNEKITPFGGAILLGDVIRYLGIAKHINKHLPNPKSNAGTAPSTKVIPALLSMILGGSSFSDIDKIGEDEVIKKICNLKRLPDSSTINRFYNKYGESFGDIAVSDSIREIGRLSSRTVIKALKKQKLKSVTLDQDATYMKVQKYDAKMSYKGFHAYSSMTCFIAGIRTSQPSRPKRFSDDHFFAKYSSNLTHINKNIIPF